MGTGRGGASLLREFCCARMANVATVEGLEWRMHWITDSAGAVQAAQEKQKAPKEIRHEQKALIGRYHQLPSMSQRMNG